FVVEGDDVELDRAILEEIGEPLVHLLRNSVDHGIETPEQRVAAGKTAKGRIRVWAERERSSVRIVVEDDGRGVAAEKVVARARAAGLLEPEASGDVTDEELFRLLSHAGLSTAEQVSDVSGRGVGMDVVVSRIRALGGAIEMRTWPGSGTAFHIRLPITLALALALRVRIGDEEYAIPLTHVSEAVELQPHAFLLDGREMLQLRDEQMPLVRMRRRLRVPPDGGTEQAAVIAEMGDRRAALAVDELIGREQILVKTFDPVAGMLPYFSGATMLADGRPALVLDPLSVI
ncbi:MAG: chemotaxis protein CheW, partial [Gemmatimonadota bacterium]